MTYQLSFNKSYAYDPRAVDIGWLDRVRLGLIDYDSRLYLSAYDDPA
jgi:hypothetical protein